MLIVLPVLGTGTPDDPFRVDLPTYRAVAELQGGALWAVDVPDTDGPDPADTGLPVLVAPGVFARRIEGLTLLARLRWRRRLDQRYAELSGRFRPA